MYKKIQKKKVMYKCPFCKRDIVSSKKTEVYYQNHWINGCFECFGLSVSELTTVSFQQKNY